ncbi:MAG: hypothetical protein ACLP01_10865 [Solirubrobacteraceae bacterium]
MGATRQIVLERPQPMRGVPPEDVAEYTALSLLHESLHLRFSSSFESYGARRRTLPLAVQKPVEHLFQLLEDGRITALALREDPALAPSLRRFMEEAIRQVIINGSAAEGTDPPSMREQLFLALQIHALQPGRRLALHPRVQRRLDELDPIIERAHHGDTEHCGQAALELVAALTSSVLPT